MRKEDLENVDTQRINWTQSGQSNTDHVLPKRHVSMDGGTGFSRDKQRDKF